MNDMKSDAINDSAVVVPQSAAALHRTGRWMHSVLTHRKAK